jgi:hypothetical protein
MGSINRLDEKILVWIAEGSKGWAPQCPINFSLSGRPLKGMFAEITTN